ncbi:hypothetical protein D0860_02692 [Hortaea werneckii]|uniref:Uncharacterized protein n=1 Tax=Hortaea werneckii TaxID=91943 RepID=A0A3M7HI86_HORWE|nr:hypothetical protein D0860_02692 [Hortaea werneckii]
MDRPTGRSRGIGRKGSPWRTSARTERGRAGKGGRNEAQNGGAQKPSLMEQLFPEETRRYEEARRHAAREIPRLPLDTPPSAPEREEMTLSIHGLDGLPRAARRLQDKFRQDDAISPEITVLVMRNASPNLVEEDFRRLIPQGRHMEGWTLEQGDILKVIAGRNLATLAHAGYYYLLFSSRLSAFIYQAHATRIFRLVSAHTPASLASPIPPPPGYMVDGMDANAAIESFALIPASQNLELRQLNSPLSPMMESLVKHRGYASIVKREGKSPYEARLVLDGPQLSANTVRHVLHTSGKDMAVAWSGGQEIAPKISKWVPRANVNPAERDSPRAITLAAANARTEEEQMQRDYDRLQSSDFAASKQSSSSEMARRTPRLVYILGFKTEASLRSFIAFWHRREMTWRGADSGKDVEGDLPPVANVEML